MKKTFLLVCIILNSLVVFGYNKKNHAIITRCAIQLLNNYFQKEFITNDEAYSIIKGNVSEDNSILKHLIRLWNQHFYNPFKPEELWRRSKSIDVRFKRIAKRWIKRIGSGRYFYSVGEIIHHIQDCTNPAHVIPIYHGGSLKDRFDEQDCDNFLPDSINIDTTVNYYTPYITSILNPVVGETLTSINDQFEILLNDKNNLSSKKIDWSYFWQDNPNAWFGKYGLLGNTYTDKKITIGEITYLINERIYKDYSSRQIALAVVQTANFIYFAKKQLQQDAQNKSSK